MPLLPCREVMLTLRRVRANACVCVCVCRELPELSMLLHNLCLDMASILALDRYQRPRHLNDVSDMVGGRENKREVCSKLSQHSLRTHSGDRHLTWLAAKMPAFGTGMPGLIPGTGS